MVDGRRSVLLAGLDDALARRVVIALDPLWLQFHRVASPAAIGDQGRLAQFGVIIVAWVGERSVVAGTDGLEALSSGSDRRVAVVMLCPRDLLSEASSSRIGHGVARVVEIESLESELREVVSTLLGVAPRYRIQAPVRLVPVAATDDPGAVGTTENISLTGMLVSCMEDLPVGTSVRFEITLPDLGLTLRGSARVVRTADPVRERTHGIGARFVSFADAGEERLHDLLSGQVH